MTLSLKTVTAMFAAVVLLAGCKTTPVGENEYNDPRYNDVGANGGLFGSEGLVLFGKGSKSPEEQGGAPGLGVNAYLWRAALDTLSFMPLASADPFGGVIITDWYQPPSAPGERFKVTVYILGRQLRTDALKLAVFRQVEQGGQWVDAPVSPNTSGEIENKVLARARELRSQATAGS
jgi:hypothetical protein